MTAITLAYNDSGTQLTSDEDLLWQLENDTFAIYKAQKYLTVTEQKRLKALINKRYCDINEVPYCDNKLMQFQRTTFVDIASVVTPAISCSPHYMCSASACGMILAHKLIDINRLGINDSIQQWDYAINAMAVLISEVNVSRGTNRLKWLLYRMKDWVKILRSFAAKREQSIA